MSFYKAYIRIAKPKKKLSVQYIDRTFLYYGGAESKVAVAMFLILLY